MIRKQLYISEAHERAVKLKAREMGVSEVELVRRLLDRLLVEGENGGAIGLGRAEAVSGFLEAADRIAGAHRFAEEYSFDREELYEDRGVPRERGG